MRKTMFFIFALLSVLFSFQVQAQEATPQEGWTPKWNVGDWWVVEVEYDLAEFDVSGMMNETIWQIIPVKYSIVAEEDLDGERVYKIEIRPSKEPAGYSPRPYNLWVSCDNLQVRKIKENPSENGTEYIFDKDSSALSVSSGNFALHVIPIFPLPAEKKDTSRKRKYKLKMLVDGQWKERDVEIPALEGQTSELIDLTSLPQDEKIKKEFLQGNFYKVAIKGGNESIQYWSKDLPWWVYCVRRSIKGYLREYHISPAN